MGDLSCGFSGQGVRLKKIHTWSDLPTSPPGRSSKLAQQGRPGGEVGREHLRTVFKKSKHADLSKKRERLHALSYVLKEVIVNSVVT